MLKQRWFTVTLICLFALGITLAQEDDKGSVPQPPKAEVVITKADEGPDETAEEAQARSSFQQASDHIAADLKKEMAEIELDDTRKKRITLMAVSAYHMNGNSSLWDNVENQESADSDIRELLEFNGINDKLRVPSFTLSEVFVSEESPVAKNDLRATLRLAEVCLLLKEGPYNLDIGWGNDWSKDDFAGEGDTVDQERRLAHNFATMVAEKPDSQVGVALSYVPQNWIYRRFIEQLVVTRSSAEPPELVVTTFLRAGNDFEQANDLALYLQEEGHLDEDGLEGVLSKQKGVYTEALAEAVKSYQKSKGLATDGIIGPATAKRISQNNAVEESQLLLNLNRARFMPNNPGKRHVIINLPSSKVYGLNKNQVSSEIKVAFGKDQDGYRTPIFRDQMEFVVFQPGKSSDSERSVNLSKRYFPTSSTGVSRGPKGTVSFLFPNNHSVFFDDSEASSSTGSLRVSEPEAMARWVLETQDWTEYAVQKAMKSGRSQWVKLEEPLSVYIVYFTVFPKIDQHSGVNFHLDYYNRDKIDQEVL